MGYLQGKTGTALYTRIADKNIADHHDFRTLSVRMLIRLLLQEIACTSGGIYANIPDGDLIQQMSSYYKRMQFCKVVLKICRLQLGWSLIYIHPSTWSFFRLWETPFLIVREKQRLWIGVVGVDFTISELEEAVGGTDRYQAVLDELVAVSTALFYRKFLRVLV